MLKNKHIILLLFLSLTVTFPVFANSAVDSTDEITVMTFNIQTTSDYTTYNKKEWVASIVRDYNVDILGIQELHITQVKNLKEILPGYDWFGVGRDDGLTTGEMGPIFYNTNKFKLVEQSTFWLSETPEIPGSKSWNTDNTRMVTWGEFIDKRSGKIFYAFNTHFDQASGWARDESAKMLVDSVTAIAGYNPVVITGDFNTAENTSPYNYITGSYTRHLKLFDSKMISATPSFGPSGSYNGYNDPSPTWKIDFVFVNPYVKVLTHGVIDRRPAGMYISDHYPVIAQVYFHYPSEPIAPKLRAVASDGKVTLQWDDRSEKHSVEYFIDENGTRDFEGYKLYRSTDPQMNDAVLVKDSWNIPLLRKPIFQCDSIDAIKDFTDYGIQNGMGYYQGSNTGIRHYYEDTDVLNGVTYYYVLTAYDKGIPETGYEIPPAENSYSIELDNYGDVKSKSANMAVATPSARAAGFVSPSVNLSEQNNLLGTAAVTPIVSDYGSIKTGHTYKIKFAAEELDYLTAVARYRHPWDLLSVNNGISVYDVTQGDSLVYSEDKNDFSGDNLKFDIHKQFWHFNTQKIVSTEIFEGLQIKINMPFSTGAFDSANSGWLAGSSHIQITPSKEESAYYPFSYDIIFTGNDTAYTSRTTLFSKINDTNGEGLGPANLLLDQQFNFYVINKTLPDSNGQFEKLDLLVQDVNMNKQFDPDSDLVLVGPVVDDGRNVRWSGTVFSIDFRGVTEMPKPDDVYRVRFNRPFSANDSLLFTVKPAVETERSMVSSDMNRIKVIPNPFISVKSAAGNSYRYNSGQQNGIYFSHIPAQSTIKIFTASGVLVKEISVNNSPVNGMVQWDMLSKDGLEIAAGIYIYHVKSKLTGDEKTGKFAVIK